jgi:predicted unusual protein kinase regulating ubiquinone biosynthesis (AarF/ABC1/UbiB family)
VTSDSSNKNGRPKDGGSRVPVGRFERLARLGVVAGRLAVGALAEGTRRVASGLPMSPGDLLLTAGNAERLARELSRMRGAAMKLGQMLSLEADVTLPAPFAQALAILRSEGSYMPSAQLHGVLGRELGRGWRERLAFFEEEPIAAASIGQVHRARTHDGREIVLKVQFPGIAKSISSDVDNLGMLLRMARILPDGFDIKPMLQAVKVQLKRETDYEREAESMERYRKLVGDDASFVVPTSVPELTTRRVLAMSFEEGVALADLWEGDYAASTRDAVGRALQRQTLRELFEFRFMQSDPNFANFLWRASDKRVVLLDFGSMVELEEAMVNDYARLCRGAMHNDRDQVSAAVAELGWVEERDRSDCVDALIELVMVACEPLRHRGRYDFGNTDLADRAREIGVDLAFGKGFFRPPPPAAMFLHRKLGGTYLVCAQLRARVDCRKLLTESLLATDLLD